MAKKPAGEGNTEKTVFISWSGPFGRRLAEGLRDTIFSFPGRLRSWVSSQDIHKGTVWEAQVGGAAQTADFGVTCLTPADASSPWINFETGFLLGKLGRCYVLSFKSNVPTNYPLKSINPDPGDDLQVLTELVANFLGDPNDKANFHSAQMHVKGRYEAWTKIVNPLLSEIDAYVAGRLHLLVESAQQLSEKLPHHAAFASNTCFREVMLTSFEESLNQMDDVIKRTKSANGVYFSVPASNYPLHLIRLQERWEARVKAVALLDYVEHFWSQDAGKRILSSTRPGSVRVFVFKDAEQFNKNIEIVRTHASKEDYHVYAISYDELALQFQPHNKDYSVISIPNQPSQRILAEYDDSHAQKMVRFYADSDRIAKHEKVLDEIVHWATRVQKDSDPDQIRESVFSGLKRYPMRYVEMSDYISVEKYDKHEEKHAYFVAMMDKMIELIRAKMAENGTSVTRILELGAGTGIFTRRLATLQNVEVVALEIDIVCYQKLKHNLDRIQNVSALLKDSRLFDPDGKFHVVCSSFADHHIRPQDRTRYFDNVKHNLLAGGFFIVGDEFLPQHDPDDKTQRSKALRAYHEHIIQIARLYGHHELAELEEEALESGLKADVDGQGGDFKVSCELYEQFLKRAGFQFKSTKIGPHDLADVGGIYVYCANL